jgi:hypothetical protein
VKATSDSEGALSGCVGIQRNLGGSQEPFRMPNAAGKRSRRAGPGRESPRSGGSEAVTSTHARYAHTRIRPGRKHRRCRGTEICIRRCGPTGAGDGAAPTALLPDSRPEYV